MSKGKCLKGLGLKDSTPVKSEFIFLVVSPLSKEVILQESNDIVVE